MRIVHLTPSYHPILGGAEAHLQAVSEGLARRGHEVLVVTQRRAGGMAGRVIDGLARDEVVGGVRVHRVPPDRFTERALLRAARWPGIYRLARAAIGEMGLRDPERWSAGVRAHVAIRRFRPDVVAVMNWYFAGLPAALARRRRRRFARVGIPLFHTEEAWSHQPGYAGLIRRYDAMLVNTDHERQFIERLVPGASRVTVAGVGVDPAACGRRNGAALRGRLGLGDAPLVGFLGRLDPTKGVVALIEAMPLVWRSQPEARLLLAGRSFPQNAPPARAIAEALARLPADARHRVTMLESPDDRDKCSFFDAVDVYAMPSLAESFGIAYLEAWLCRKPVVGAAAGSTPYVIRHGVDGLLVDPGDTAGLARVLAGLLADPAGRARMGQAGYERTMAERTWDRVTDTVEALYADLTEARRRRAMLPTP